MIDFIKGNIAEITPANVVLETNAIGYELNISLHTYSAINSQTQVKLYVHESIREDAYVLFGFSDKAERNLFRQLITVSGIGPSTARVMLSSASPHELTTGIVNEDVALLKSFKGIGAKTAERVIVELKDKLKLSDVETTTKAANSANVGVKDEAVAALVILGFVPKQSEKVVLSILKESPTLSVDKVIKTALKML